MTTPVPKPTAIYRIIRMDNPHTFLRRRGFPKGKFLFCITFLFLLAAAVAFSAGETVNHPGGSSNDSEIEACEAEITKLAAYSSAAAHDAPKCAQGRYDVIIVLGYPSNQDCTPSGIQLARVDIAMRFFKAGHAGRFIPTGGAVYNKCVEAETIKGELIKRGVPEVNVFPEPRAEHTDENIYFASKIMKANGWKTALIVSDPVIHLSYTGLCDSNCCVKLGRSSLFRFKPGQGKPVHAIRYTLHPFAPEVDEKNCEKMVRKNMCSNIETRRSCARLEWREKMDAK